MDKKHRRAAMYQLGDRLVLHAVSLTKEPRQVVDRPVTSLSRHAKSAVLAKSLREVLDGCRTDLPAGYEAPEARRDIERLTGGRTYAQLQSEAFFVLCEQLEDTLIFHPTTIGKTAKGQEAYRLRGEQFDVTASAEDASAIGRAIKAAFSACER